MQYLHIQISKFSVASHFHYCFPSQIPLNKMYLITVCAISSQSDINVYVLSHFPSGFWLVTISWNKMCLITYRVFAISIDSDINVSVSSHILSSSHLQYHGTTFLITFYAISIHSYISMFLLVLMFCMVFLCCIMKQNL